MLRADFIATGVPHNKTLQLAAENVVDNSILGFEYVSDAIEHELRVFWAFTWRDWSASLIPGAIYTVAALRSLDSVSTEVVIQALTRSFVYFLLYIYSFDIANQINGVAEDRINKPDRPPALPHSKARTSDGTPRPSCTSSSALHGAVYGGYKHWFTKNLGFMSIGSLCLLHGAWGLVAPITGHQWRWALLLSSVFGIVASVQDMRDMEGDKIAGRRTLPIVLGNNFRWVMASLICAAPAVCWQLEFFRYTHWLVGVCSALLSLAMFYIAYRVYQGGSSRYDHKTYMILTYIYCGCVAVPMLFP
ncbi:UbiA prenyltransferase [Mycena sanguinolenta]|uniref:UbiA prenyltransferase n=1 Tax=Mycena sanguinolenta TaxID=230812 RepID=A0A8H6YUX7_9AGAR|nr:UbiA prenyltransferase [Mycena sanguinolenta]